MLLNKRNEGSYSVQISSITIVKTNIVEATRFGSKDIKGLFNLRRGFQILYLEANDLRPISIHLNLRTSRSVLYDDNLS